MTLRYELMIMVLVWWWHRHTLHFFAPKDLLAYFCTGFEDLLAGVCLTETILRQRRSWRTTRYWVPF